MDEDEKEKEFEQRKQHLKNYMFAQGLNMYVYQMQCRAATKAMRHKLADMLLDVAEIVTEDHRRANFEFDKDTFAMLREIVDETLELERTEERMEYEELYGKAND